MKIICREKVQYNRLLALSELTCINSIPNKIIGSAVLFIYFIHFLIFTENQNNRWEGCHNLAGTGNDPVIWYGETCDGQFSITCFSTRSKSVIVPLLWIQKKTQLNIFRKVYGEVIGFNWTTKNMPKEPITLQKKVSIALWSIRLDKQMKKYMNGN